MLLSVPNCPGVGDDAVAAMTEQEEVVVVEQESEEQVVEAQTAVVSVVEADSQEVLHQVHFTMEVDGTTQEQQVRILYTFCTFLPNPLQVQIVCMMQIFSEMPLPLTLPLLLVSLLLSRLRRKP